MTEQFPTVIVSPSSSGPSPHHSFTQPLLENFYDICKAQLQVCKKNTYLKSKLKDHLTPSFFDSGRSFFDSGISFTEPHKTDEKLNKKIEEKRKKRNLEIPIPEPQAAKSDPNSFMIFFIVRSQDLRHIIPDHELSVCKKRFAASISLNARCHEAYFGLSRLKGYEGRFIEAVSYINTAISLNPDPFYLKWSVLLSVKSNKTVKFSSSPQGFLCCCSTQQNSQENIISRLESLPRNIETLWCYMELCRSGVENEAAEYYATCIKEIDPYFGYLAWSDIYMVKEWQKAVDVLKELICKYPYRPEAYAKLWTYYYHTARNYEAAEDIASEAFLRVTNADYNNYYIIFCISCAKSLFKTGKTSSSLQLLQKKFLENSEFTIFLYQFGRLCCKSEDPLYLGSGIGALKECAKLCESCKMGKIFYWLSKAFLQNRQYLEAYTHISRALEFADNLFIKKREMLKAWAMDLEPYISDIKQMDHYLEQDFSPKVIDESLTLIKKIKKFHRLSANIIEVKILWKLGKRRESIEKVKQLCELGQFRGRVYRILFRLLKKSNEFSLMEKSALEMIEKCRNTNVQTEFWVNANIWYAKALAKNGKPNKAMIVLKAIAKVFTPLPYISIPYTRALQRASNVQELIEPSLIQFHLYEAYKSSFATIRDFSQKVIEENDAPMPESGSFKGRRAERTMTEGMAKYRQFYLHLSEGQDDEIGPASTLIQNNSENEEEFIGISVYSDPKFLFLIAKFAYKFNTSIEDGICAIKDFLEIINFRNKGKKYSTLVRKAEKMLKFLSDSINY